MSVQVAKSTGNAAPTQGRRTPLSLSGSVGKSTSKVHRSSSDSEKDAKKTNSSSPITSLSKTASKNDKNETSTTDLNKKINDKIGDKKNANNDNQATENTNISAKDKNHDDKKKEDKKKDKDMGKKDEKKKETVTNNEKESSQANGHKEVQKNHSEKSEEHKNEKQEIKDSKENNKTSELKKSDEKKDNKKNEDDESKKATKEKNITEDVLDKPIEIHDSEEESIEIKKKNKKEPETPKKDVKKSKEVDSTTPAKEVIHKSVFQQAIATKSVEKDIKASVPDNDDMESLVVDSESDSNTGPIETSTPGKILKINQNPPSSVQSTYYEHRETYEKHKTVQLKEDRPNVSIATDTPLERPQFTASYRTISGRRSLRPLKEYSFQTTYKESYRKINTDLDYTTSSMNVTVGSERPNESSFSLFSRGKKRERTPPPVTSTNESNESNDSQMDIDLSPKSPKRARLDFSGIIGFVASPVTLLRAKFSRTKIQCSTPNGKVTSTTKDEEDGVENVSTIATEEMISSDIVDNSQNLKSTDTEPLEKEINNELNDLEDVEIAENIEVQDVKKISIGTGSVENVNKRRMCNVM